MAEDLGGVEMAEVMRVLAPQGVVCVKDGVWKKTVKPRPQDIDEWTHYLHGPNNNAVAQDAEVGSPRHLQWLAEPRHARSHEHLATVSVVVSAQGRLFSIVDEGPTLAVVLPARWRLVACDAFNGLELWRRPIGPWEPHMNWFRAGPGSLARRLVAVGDRVYVTPGYGRAVVAIDAATGRTVKTYQGSENAREIVCANGVLYLVLGEVDKQQAGESLPSPAGRGAGGEGGLKSTAPHDRILALDAATGNTLWSLENDDSEKVMATTLAVAGDRAYFQNRKAVVCLDARSGRVQWRAPRASGGSISWSPPTLVVVDDVLLSADPTAPAPPEDSDAVKPTYRNRVQTNAGELVALSAKNGQFLWKARCYPNFMSAVNVLVADGVVWTGQLWSVVNPGVTMARDLHTGKIVRRRTPDNPDDIVVSHHRCHRIRGTDRYLVLSRAGIDLLGTKSMEMEFNPWIRGTCQLGPLPCNGLLYAPPHSCACFAEAMFPGYVATADQRAPAPAPGPALEKGRAYGTIEPAAHGDDPQAWPTYRGDAARSGATLAPLSATRERAWQCHLGGRLSAERGRRHGLRRRRRRQHGLRPGHPIGPHAVDLYSRRPRRFAPHAEPRLRPLRFRRWLGLLPAGRRWRVDVAFPRGAQRPAGRRSRAVGVGLAGARQRVGARGPGLVGRGTYVLSGRRVVPVPPRSGQRQVLGDDPKSTNAIRRRPRIRPAFSAVSTCRAPRTTSSRATDNTSSCGTWCSLRTGPGCQPTSRTCSLLPDFWTIPGGTAPTGSSAPRWTRAHAGGAWRRTQYPQGQLLSLGRDVACGFGRTNANKENSHVGAEDTRFQLFAVAAEKQDRQAWAEAHDWKSAVRYRWRRSIPLLGRAMVLAGKTLWVAGPPDRVLQKNAEASAALAGAEGGLLWAVSAADGQALAQYKLEAPPVFDGMAASAGRLFVSLQNGRILCLKGREQEAALAR